MKMVDAQEEFDLRPRVTEESSREDLVEHIKDCQRRLLHLQKSAREAIELFKRSTSIHER